MTLGSKIQQAKQDALAKDIEQRLIRLEKAVADLKIYKKDKQGVDK